MVITHMVSKGSVFTTLSRMELSACCQGLHVSALPMGVSDRASATDRKRLRAASSTAKPKSKRVCKRAPAPVGREIQMRLVCIVLLLIGVAPKCLPFVAGADRGALEMWWPYQLHCCHAAPECHWGRLTAQSQHKPAPPDGSWGRLWTNDEKG
ncbi:hypothetical protein ZHAS_00021053 [Anopheles sinensis]|uniref:Uncharacterized protein n=1 Tax=Anopheles sinensis TaxID=74873 RepID=A0A084WRE3_ANOSI|nr:hypothetical protein ZHAS_00021053 [Anopheles sinensis]